MRGLLIAAALVIASPAAAQQTGVYRTYAQWAAMGASERAAYIAGAVDSIIVVAAADEDKKNIFALRPMPFSSEAERYPTC